MRKIFFVALLAFGLNASAQITIEHKYDSASDYQNNILMIVKFELSGQRYVKINRTGKEISIYNLNHSLIKTISVSNYPQSSNGLFMVLYMSEQLFDTDSAIEFLYGYIDANTIPHTRIYKEDGTAIFIADSLYSWDEISVPQQQYTIYNTQQGTKMILSHINGQSWVFSLPGILSEGIFEANNNLIAMQTQSYISNAYPNPTNNATQIDYKLPDGINEGEIVFYDLTGNEVKRFKVDRTFNTLLISTSDINSGTYYFQLQTTGQNSEGKKLIVIK